MFEKITTLLEVEGIQFTIHEHEPSRTFADAKERSMFSLERLLKTVAFRHKSGYFILAVLRGQDRVDYRKIASALGTKRGEIVQLSPTEVREAFGVEVGSMGPIQMLAGLEVLFDNTVPLTRTVFCGVGRADRTLEIGFSDLVRVARGRILPLSSSSEPV